MREILHKKAPEAPKRSPDVRGLNRTSRSHFVAGQMAVLHNTVGNQAVRRLFVSGILQAKLKIGPQNDIYEQEADRVADEVMRMPVRTVVSDRSSVVGKSKESTLQLKPG